GVAMLLVTLLTAGVLYESGFWGRITAREEGSGFWGILAAASTLDLVLIALAYVFAVFTSVYCNATMFATAWQRLDGERPSLRAAIRQVNRVLPELIGWSCLT